MSSAANLLRARAPLNAYEEIELHLTKSLDYIERLDKLLQSKKFFGRPAARSESPTATRLESSGAKPAAVGSSPAGDSASAALEGTSQGAGPTGSPPLPAVLGSDSSKILGRMVAFFTTSDLLSKRALVFLDVQKVDAALKIRNAARFDVSIRLASDSSSAGHLADDDSVAASVYSRILLNLKKTGTCHVLAACLFKSNSLTQAGSPGKVGNETTSEDRRPMKQREMQPGSPSAPMRRSSIVLSMRITRGSVLFSVLRDTNAMVLPFLVPRDQKEEFIARFGMSDAADNSPSQQQHLPTVEIRSPADKEQTVMAPWRRNASYKTAMAAVSGLIQSMRPTVGFGSWSASDRQQMLPLGRSPESPVQTTAAALMDALDGEGGASASIGGGIRSTGGNDPPVAWVSSDPSVLSLNLRIRFTVKDTTLQSKTVVYLNPSRVESSFMLDRKYVGWQGKHSRRFRSLRKYEEIKQLILRKAKATTGSLSLALPCAELLELEFADVVAAPALVGLETAVSSIVHFVDGSHVYAVLRDLGLPCVPVLVLADEADEFIREYGFSDGDLQSSGLPSVIVEKSTKDDALPWRRSKSQSSHGNHAKHSAALLPE